MADKLQVEKDREKAAREAALEQEFAARGGMSPWISLLGQWGGTPGLERASMPVQAKAPSMSLEDRLALERMKQEGKERLTILGQSVKKDKPAKQFQETAALNAVMIDEANRQMEESVKKGFKPGGYRAQLGEMASYIPFVGERGKEDEQQQYESAQLTFADAVLRFRTGAQANEEEIRKTAAELFPRKGDSKAAIASKKLRRTVYQKSIRKIAGKSYKELAAELKKKESNEPKEGATQLLEGVTYRYSRTTKTWNPVK